MAGEAEILAIVEGLGVCGCVDWGGVGLAGVTEGEDGLATGAPTADPWVGACAAACGTR